MLFKTFALKKVQAKNLALAALFMPTSLDSGLGVG